MRYRTPCLSVIGCVRKNSHVERGYGEEAGDNGPGGENTPAHRDYEPAELGNLEDGFGQLCRRVEDVRHDREGEEATEVVGEVVSL